MAKINVLTPEVYNYIAAGEVVERPASVVKELVENSIDAGATIIEVNIVDGGTSSIRVSDNGTGIEEGDLRKAFMPHATSKIKAADDLNNILTLGFRGEALASIAAVSKVSMVSKQPNKTAFEIRYEGGKETYFGETSSKDGTTAVVEDLFYCVPARLKFLKKPKSEEQEITNLISRFILSNPEIAITYIADGRTIYSSSGTNLQEAMFCVYGKSALEQTLEIDLTRGDLRVVGYVGRPSYSKPNRTYQTLVINGRYVVNQTVATAVTNAYGEMLMKRKYPFYILELKMPTDSIDVNVHPNKLDVRFENQGQIYSLFFEAVSRALSNMDYVASATDEQLENYKVVESTEEIRIVEPPKAEKIDRAGVNLNPFSKNLDNLSSEEKIDFKSKVLNAISRTSVSTESGGVMQDGFGLGSKLLERLDSSTDSNQKGSEPEAKQQDLGLDSAIKTVGKVFNTYLILEVDDDIFFIDQHAAHERLLYEKFKNEYDNKRIVIQPLLFPYVLSLNSIEASILAENLETMRSLGFEVDEFGKNTFKVSAVPAIVSEMNFDTFFSEFLSEGKNISKKNSELIRDYLMQHSCKSAIKGGNDLSENEINHLFSQMGKEKIALFCPHGRPIAIRLSKQELEKWFKRIV